jgi:arylsulfatase A
MRPTRCAIALALLLLAPLVMLHAAERKPNVVLILIDDFGYECVTANGGESYQTPVMDKLAATGVRFEQCHVQPLCTPTRVQLMTGLGNKRNYTHFGHLDPSQKTFGNLLRNAGYATCVAGKWQLGNGFEGPAHFGFDEYCLWQLVRRPGRYKNPGLEINGKQHDYRKNEYGPDLVSDYALDFITRKKDGPFFLYYPMMLTHAPYDATPDSPAYLTTKAAAGAKEPNYFPDMVAYADKLIGKVVAKLEELQLRDNTLLLVLGDNGNGGGRVSKFKGRDVHGGKGSTTMWGTHVPAIGNWPGHLASGKVSTDLIDATDFLPTICEATATPVPAELNLDGRSFLPQLRGEKGQPREWLYAWYNPNGGATAKAEFAHDQQFKLYTTGRFYDVGKDDREKTPLAEAALTPEARAARVKLQAALKQHAGPRDEVFAKQTEISKGETGEDAEGNKKAKGGKQAAPAVPAATSAAQAGQDRVARFTARDQNHDGTLSWEEFLATASQKQNAKPRFEQADANQDGFLSREEFMNMGAKTK